MPKKVSQPFPATKQQDEAHLIIGPIGFHPEDCFEGVFSIVGDSGEIGGDEGTPSIGNISSETPLDIGVGAELSGIDPHRATPERPLIG